jgi:hypothetical protein
MTRPSVGRVVHYVSHGTPVREDGSQAFESTCRAAIIAGIPYPDEPDIADSVDLTVFNPTGLFFHAACPHEEPEDGPLVGGTWHWPERV